MLLPQAILRSKAFLCLLLTRLLLCFMSLLLPQLGAAQPAPYRNLVMRGGGIRGIAYGGAPQELERRGVRAEKEERVESGRAGVRAFCGSGQN